MMDVANAQWRETPQPKGSPSLRDATVHMGGASAGLIHRQQNREPRAFSFLALYSNGALLFFNDSLHHC